MAVVYLEPLDRVLRRQPVRLALLLDFVRYPHHPLVQAEAVRLAQFLSARTPDMVDLLLSAHLPGERSLFQNRLPVKNCKCLW